MTKKNEALTEVHEGTVKFFNDSKGYGFLTEDATEKDYFVHITGLMDQIGRGDKVTFEVTEGKKGPIAVNVQYVGKNT